MKRLFGILLLINIFVIASCSAPHQKPSPTSNNRPTLVDRSTEVIPKVEPKSKYGNPQFYEVFGERYFVLDSAEGYEEQGVASWYGPNFHGKRTSSGETYDQYAMTAAHKTLPLPTYAHVTNLRNGRSIIVRINDRGPFHDNRIIDLSYTAATQLGIVMQGTGLVEVRAINPETYNKLPEVSVRDVKEAEPVEVANAATAEPEKQIDIFVQIGAFRVLENASKLKAQYTAFQLGKLSVNEFTFDEQPIYKVWIGPLQSVQEADQTISKLSNIGHSDYKVVFEESVN